jgi:MFS family permease
MTLSHPEQHHITAQEWLQLFAACLTAILIPLCFTGPAVVLPSINHDLGGSAVQLNWVINGYILTYGSAMMAAGSLTDIYGRKKVWLVGLSLFSIVTLAIPYAPSVVWIDILRLAQGLGGAAAFAGAMASLAQVFHGAIRTRVFSLLGTTFGIGLAFGPLAAGWLVDSAGWKWVFFATALIGVIGFLLVLISAHESRDPNAKGLDWLGAISFTAALTLFTYAILLAPEEGWGNLLVISTLIASIVLFAGFVVIEQRVTQPMLDLSLFKSKRFVGVQLLGASPAFFYVVLIIMLPARFIGVDGHTALEAGQLMIALSAPLLIVPFITALLARWVTAGMLSSIGLVVVALGLVWLGYAMPGGQGEDLVAPMLLIGIGIGMPWGLMDGLAVSVVAKERAGMATGIFNAVRVSADGIAIAVVGALFAFLIQTHLAVAVTAAGAHIEPSHLLEAANRSAMGDLAHAITLPNPWFKPMLLTSYDTSFQTLLYILAIAALGIAAVVFLLLGKVRTHDDHVTQLDTVHAIEDIQ